MNTPGLRDPVVMRVLSEIYCLVCFIAKDPEGLEALKGHRVVWKIEIYYLIRMT